MTRFKPVISGGGTGSGVDVVYPIHGDSATCGGSRYLVEEPLVDKTSERRPEIDGGGISSILRIWSTVVELAGSAQRRSLRVLIESASTENYINARCQIALDL